MRYLRLYNENSSFESDEQTAGGTGNDIESMVPGVVKTVDNRKIYFNSHDKEILLKTITISYKDTAGNKLAEDDVKTVKYFSGVTQEMVVTPKKIEGYYPVEDKKTINVTDESGCVMKYINTSLIDKPLTFIILSAGTIIWSCTNSNAAKTIDYKLNNNAWSSITSTISGVYINVNSGDTVQFRGDNATYSNLTSSYSTFGNSTAKFIIEGNIMSLINSTGFASLYDLSSGYTFYRLFRYCQVTDASNLILPATGLTTYCYAGMLNSCTSLTIPPELPATTLATYCYSAMFLGASSLTVSPILPATNLASYCYSSMFRQCYSLTTPPVLPATTLADNCYPSMFYGCSGLTTAPALPATALTVNCYQNMFSACTSLTTAPELPAKTLVNECYSQMFIGCSSLNYIKCLATDKSAYNCTYEWVQNVAASGTFVKDANMSSWTTGNNGIPNGWTVQDA